MCNKKNLNISRPKKKALDMFLTTIQANNYVNLLFFFYNVRDTSQFILKKIVSHENKNDHSSHL